MIQLAVDRERIAEFCRSHQISRLALFGSVLRPDFRADSDVDVLVAFLPGIRPTLFDLVRMQQELVGILGREVDLVDQASVEQSANYLRRKEILSSGEVLHGA